MRLRAHALRTALLLGSLAFGLWTLAGEVHAVGRAGYDALAGPNRLVADADLDPLASFASTEALALARARIPAHATYAVLVGRAPASRALFAGPGLAVHPALLRIAFEFWLLPRRFTDRVGDAQWLIIYGRGVPRPAVEVRRRISLGPAATLLEVAR